MKKEENTFESSTGQCKIHVVTWYPDEDRYKKPVGIIQIAHGMIDHIERYDELAEYLTDKGYIVTGNDHLGHGESVAKKEDLGFFTKKHPSSYVVKDMYRLTTIMKSKYPTLPYFLIGHSMGSFLTRRYITLHGHVLDGVAILGTGNHPVPLLWTGKFLSTMISLFYGKRHVSPFVNKLMFGNFNKKITDPKTKNDWMTMDERKIQEYCDDPKCQFGFSINGCSMILDTLLYLSKVRNMKKIPKTLPIFLAAGKEDPVGNYGKSVTKLAKRYQRYGLNCQCMIYDGFRHELHNELNRDLVFDDLYQWLKACV